MNLDPTVSPWIGIFASTGVCLWMAAIGAPLARAVFGDRPRPVWPFYAPALGIVAVLLTTNLSAYVIPGAPSAWFGLLVPTALAAAVAWRDGQIRIPSRRAALASLALLFASTGVFVLAFANRTQTYHTDESWHYALALRLARGAFPPVTPYGPDAGIGYHYGHNLLAASIVNMAAVPAWTAMVVLLSFLVVALILAVVGFTRDKGGSLPLSIGAGAVLGLFPGTMRVGLPPYIEASGQSQGFTRFLEGLAPAEASVAFQWLHSPQYTIAVTIVILIAAALDVRATSRTAAVLVVAAGVSALADASVLIFSSAALGMVGVLRLASLRGRERLALAAALLVAGLLAALAGGPVSDALFDRGGTAGMARIAFEPNWTQLAPLGLSGPMLVRFGVISLLAISSLAAYRRRSWGLLYLTVAVFLGIVEAMLLQSPIPSNDGRILNLSTAIAAFAALSGVASLASGLRYRWRNLAMLAVILLAVLPTAVPRTTAGVRLASQGFGVGQPVSAGSGYPFVGQTPFRRELFRKDLEENWDFYSWLSSRLPNDARLLTTHPATIASAAGIAAPASGLGIQALSPRVTPVYEDALRFLHRNDLADMSITHLHVTDAWRDVLKPEAQRLLDDPDHFRLLADTRSNSGRRHRVFEVVPGAGTLRVDPASFRALRQSVPLNQPFVILDGLTAFQRQMLLYTFVDNEDLRAPPTLFGRSTQIPKVNPVSDIPSRGWVALSERIDPIMLGLSEEDAIWTGYGVRVYDLASAWSPVWRVGVDFPTPLERFRVLCERASNGHLSLRVLGEPGDELLLGLTSVRLTGKLQTANISVGTCKTLRLSEKSGVKPFAQVRSRESTQGSQSVAADSALGFDGGYDGDMVIMNLWYRNPDRIPFVGGTELRLYEIGPIGATPKGPNPGASIRWWIGPVALGSETQMARVEFDPKKLQVNGEDGGGVANEATPGRTYLLALNVSVVGTVSNLVVIQQQIPLARFEYGDSGDNPEVYAGIVNVRRPVMSHGLAHEYSSKIGSEINRTPGFQERGNGR